jgi:hypothetical protein
MDLTTNPVDIVSQQRQVSSAKCDIVEYFKCFNVSGRGRGAGGIDGRKLIHDRVVKRYINKLFA